MQPLHCDIVTDVGALPLILSIMQNSQNSPTKRACSLDLLHVGQYFIIQTTDHL
jgi:hypothetical protein